MEDEVILSRPTDRRLVDENSSLPPGPPGAENDSFDLVQKEASAKKDSRPVNRDPRRRSTSRDKRSRSRSRGPQRRSRSRGREYSPPSRRYGSNRGRRSRERTARSPPERNRSRDRNTRRRDRSRSRERFRNRRSRSRSGSPISRRWSPMKKPPSPAMPPPPQYSVPQYDTYGSYGNQYMGQFPQYDYTNQVQVQYPTAYPCDPQTWPQAPPAAQTAPQPVPQVNPIENDAEQSKRDAAIAQEAQIQRDQLKKQRGDYLKRAAALKREMKILKEQRSDLVSTTAPPSPTTKGFVDENDRLQNQIQKKLTTIENVIDMLSSIIGEEKSTDTTDSQPGKKQRKNSKSDEDDEGSSSSSPERLKTKLIESMKSKRDNGKKKEEKSVTVKLEKVKEEIPSKIKTENTTPNKKINYSFYDPEMHWCITCDVFPKTAKDYLTHLHSESHSKNSITQETPWHDNAVNDEFPSYPNAPTKRTPIRGLQFFIPSNGWYCKLCSFWMGDLHCASSHLKSRCHWDKYNKYTEQNPHFEVDWMADRQKILDGVRAKENCAPPPPQITPVVSTTSMDLLESIPLQLNTQKVVNLDLDKKERKRKKREEKKEKKKKKRTKKRKKSSSSSSSSSSDSSSDSEKDKKPKEKEDRSNSIRVAMRKILNNDLKDGPKDAEASKNLPLSKLEEMKLSAKISGSTSKKPLESNKKDELISQWNSPQPIISESEKKLLEDLKGKLKTKTATEAQKPATSEPIDGKKRDRTPIGKANEAKSKAKRRSRSRSKRSSSVESVKRSKSKERRSASRDEIKGKTAGRKERSKSQDVQGRGGSRDRLDRRSRSRGGRSRSRERRSRSRGRRSLDRDRRSRSRGRVNRNRNRRGRFSPDRRWRRSRSRKRSRSARRSRSPRKSRSPKRSGSRRRSRSPSGRYNRRRSNSRSRSRSRSRSYKIEKPIVRFPEFRPRVPPGEAKKQKKSENDAENKKTPPPKKPAPVQPATGKKLPFIGRMPVFKKQSQGDGDDKKDGDLYDDSNFDPMTMGYDHYEMGMMADYEDLMPDPMQYVTLMGAPPPPPSEPPPDEEKDMLPPGVDESEADTVPKPINDAPMARKGPLPKDFQEALNIIFPGERKPDSSVANSSETDKSKEDSDTNAVVEQQNVEEASGDNDNSLHTDDASQHSSGEAFYGFPSAPISFSETTQDVPDIASLVAAAPPPPPPPPNPADAETKNGNTESEKVKTAKDTGTKELPSEDELRRQEELDDLAMLGIDADDLAAQCM